MLILGKFNNISNRYGNVLIVFFAVVVIIELTRHFIIGIPQYRYVQLYWHMTNNSTIKENAYEIDLPINWTMKKEETNRYILHADLRADRTMQIAMLYKEVISDIKMKLFRQDVCESNNQVMNSMQIEDKMMNVYWCKSLLADGGSLAYITDKNKHFNLMVYDYTPSDNDNIKLLIQNLHYK